MQDKQEFELSHDALSKANIGLWAIEVVDGEEPRMFADATMCRLLGIPEGLPPERIYHAWYDNIDPNHYDAVTEVVNKMADGSHAEVQYPWHHPEKGEIFVRCGGLRNMAYTRGLRFEGCHQDVTELVHIQKRLEEIKEAERAKSEFFAKVSHDIRTPLNAIIGYSQMLSAGVDSAIERKEYLDSISFSAETLLDLINDVLDLSKLEAGKMTFAAEPCDFGELVRKVLLSVAPRATSRSVELKSTVAGLPSVTLDVRHLRQILFNLIGNAVKFTEHGTVEVSARFDRTDGETGRLTFAVRDTGIGMSVEDQAGIFQPFVQARNNVQQHGTGLGLAICKQLVEKMGGTIAVSSELGKGSVFTVEIPGLSYREDVRAAAPVATTVDPVAVGQGDSALRLLLVDDIKMNLSVLKSMLKRLGIVQVTTAGDGEEAMEILRKAPTVFDAVLTDLWMPKCDGAGLLKQIRAFGPTAKLPVYAVTADVECSGGDGAQFSGVLLKPLTLDGLREFVRGIGR